MTFFFVLRTKCDTSAIMLPAGSLVIVNCEFRTQYPGVLPDNSPVSVPDIFISPNTADILAVVPEPIAIAHMTLDTPTQMVQWLTEQAGAL